jgi:hypothetical protein
MNKAEINSSLNIAQKLLWSGSLNEVDEAHNIIAKLIVDLEEDPSELDTIDFI